jgi:hypothetical protein
LALLCYVAVIFFMSGQLRMLRGWSHAVPRALADQYAPPSGAAVPPPPLSPEQVDSRAPVDNPSTAAAPSDVVPTVGVDPAKVDAVAASLHAADGPTHVPQPAVTPALTNSPERGYMQLATVEEASDEPADDASDRFLGPINNAQSAATDGRMHDWAWHLSLYLDRFGIPPLHVWERPGHLFSRLTTKPLPQVDTGPLVTVVMVACNAEDTVGYAVASILHQTWRRLELVIVDDASVDRTWSVLNDLSKGDARIKLVRNAVQVGPYVSRNRILKTSSGAYVTTQDADDWSLPRRLEIQVRDMLNSQGTVRANMMRMFRVRPSGLVSTAIPSSFSPDGVARQAFVSAMYETRLLRESLGYWDSVRYGADGEMIRRAQMYLGPGFHEIKLIGVLLADRPNTLGKQGYRTNPALHREPSQNWVGSSREAYRAAYDAWHAATQKDSTSVYLPFPLRTRPFLAPQEMFIGIDDVCSCLRGTESECKGDHVGIPPPL